MSFDWLKKLQKDAEKPANYAEKTLNAYRLGMKAKGSIAGVRIEPDPEGCHASVALDPATVYHPDEAPHIPLPSCDRVASCGCVYRPVMTYQVEGEPPESEET